MGVYIDMEMPTSCLHGGCPIDGEFCRLWEKSYWKSPDEPYRKLHPNCPLFSVPPHGRLINEKDIVPKDGYIIADGMACIPVKDIANAPTIIPASEEG